ncbi:LamG domain-containing protein, partial [Candidatus Microgenomates bacterium]
NNGTLYGDNSTGDNGTGMTCTDAGKYGTGCTFDGVDDYVMNTNSFFSSRASMANGWTYSAWIKTSSSSQQNIVGQSNEASHNDYSYGGIGTNSSNARVIIYDGSYKYATSTTNIANNTWHHVVGIYNGTDSIKIYIDGVLENTTTSIGTVGTLSTSSVNGYIGKNVNNSYARYFNGSIDEARVYNRALSPKEVADLYNFAPGPVGYWKMDDKVAGDSKTIVDTSGNGNNGTTVDGANNTGMSCNTAGKYGGGCNFDGTDDYISGDATLITSYPFTMSAWVKTTDLNVNHYVFVISTSGANGPLYGLQLNNTTGEASSTLANESWGGVSGLNNIIDGKWHYLAAVFNSNTDRTFYVDGIYQGTDTTNITFASNVNKWAVGTRPNSLGTYMHGDVDEAKIYNYARSAKQILEDMEGGHPAVGGTRSSAIAEWDFDEGQGITANNLGNGGTALNGTLTGPTHLPTWTNAGKYGKAITFDGIDDYVNAGNSSSLDLTSDGTWGGWFKLNANNITQSLINKDAGDQGWAMYVSNIGQLNLFFESTSTHGNTVITTGTWHHLVITKSGTTVTFYLDGKQDGTATGVATRPTSNTSVGIGAKIQGPQEYLNGTADEIKIYNYALTSDEVKTEYNRGSSMVLGALGNLSSLSNQAGGQEYCIPGDSTSCAVPVGEWKFEEGSGGSVNDTSGNGNTADWNGTGSHWTSGKVGKAGNFNGSDDSVSVNRLTHPSFNNLPNSDFTSEAWINLNASGNYPRIVSKGGWIFAVFNSLPNMTLWFVINLPTTSVDYRCSITIPQGSWHHVSAVYSSTSKTAQMYFDGKQLTCSTATAGSGDYGGDTAYNFTIGSEVGAGSSFFPGKIDNIRIFSYARTPAQIAWDYNKGAPIAHWDFDECSGTDLHDLSGNNNTGTITIGASGEDTVGTCTTSSTAWGDGATGKRNYSLKLDGTDDYVNVADNDVFSFGNGTTDTPFSVSAWVKPSSNITNNRYIISKRDDTGSVEREWSFNFDDEGDLSLSLIDDSANAGQKREDTTTDFLANTWYHVVGTYSGSGGSAGIKLYVDGKQTDNADNNTGSYTALENSSSAVYIGAYRWSGALAAFFPGQIDDVKIFNYALTQTQVKNLYNNGAVNFGPSSGNP